MANNIIKRIWNQNKMVNIEALQGMAFQAEAGGHTFEISGVDDSGATVSLSGTVAGVFRRPDNADIALTGAASDGKVSVTLTEDCYAVPGRFGLTIFVTDDSKKTAVYAAIGTVSSTSGGAVAGDTPQDVVDLINDIAAAVATIPASYTDLMAAIAPNYSPSSLYPVGYYVWYDGTLYCCTTPITTAETWTPAHWKAAVLGDDVSDLKNAIDTVCQMPELTWILNRNVDGSGSISTNNYMALTDAIPVSTGDIVVRKTPSAIQNRSLIGYLSEFNGSTFIRRSAFNTYNQTYAITDTNTTHIRIAFGRASSSGVQISQSDVDNYFRAEIYRRAVTYLDGFVNRGAVSDLGYTSLAQCTRQGYYTFGSTDALSDLPIGWDGGGLVYVFVTANAVWQKITSLTKSYFRYGYTGTWYSERDYIYAVYESGSGENNSTERLNIFIPRKITNEKTMYQMGHCVNTEINADVWRIMFMYRVNYNDTLRKLTMTGEWECAVHLDGRDDFSGGIVHGDEVDVAITVFVDGTVTDITDINTHCHELKIVKKSNLYDPADHSTIIAEHGIEYIYTVEGLKIKQSINWKVDATLTNCYLAMLPIIKTYSTHRFDDTSFDIAENNQTGYSVTIPNASSVAEYNTTYDTFVEMAKEIYPIGLIGGDCALISDNGGLGYNKVYFPVCASASVSVNDLWQSTTVYRNR